MEKKILAAVRPDLQPSERVLCPPAWGTFRPWSALVNRSRIVCFCLRVAAFPLALITGRPAHFVVTDARLIVLTRRLGRATSLPLIGITPLQGDVAVSGSSPYSLSEEIESAAIGYKLTLLVRDHGEVRLRFFQPSAGAKVASALFAQYVERSNAELREAMRKQRGRG
jgi:hypothetical protein